jgi:endoglucanase
VAATKDGLGLSPIRVARATLRSRLLVALLTLACCAAAPAAATGLTQSTRATAAAFLGRYAEPDGRVSRLDQGGDTVSAGQAQGMLVAVALGEHHPFARVWAWTRSHLQLRSGLLASRWRGGHIVDDQPASDADLDAARALLIAASRFHVASYRSAGLRIARAALAQETVMRGGLRVLVAGPWARTSGIVNPGYWAPRTLRQLQAATGDRRFGRLEAGVIRLAAKLTSAAPHLPSDWAAVSAGGSIHPVAAPPGRRPAPPQYSLDAARLPIRFAEACSASARRVSASLWPFFAAQGAARIGAAYTLGGGLKNRDQTAVTLVGAAAAAQSAGDAQARDQLLAQAQSINNRFPTYYGAAWIAIARIELSSSTLGGC